MRLSVVVGAAAAWIGASTGAWMSAGCGPASRPPPSGVASNAPVVPASAASASAGGSAWKPAYPSPPMQGAPWTAPSTSLAADVPAAVAALFDEGLGDPRGLDYREVSVAVGDVWSGGGDPATVHAWVLPLVPSDSPHDGGSDGGSGDGADGGANGAAVPARYAVAWNGLVYRVVSVGAAASVQADVAALLQADDAARAKQARENPGSSYRHWPLIAEATSVSHAFLTRIKVAFLLRLGLTHEAEALWGAFEPLTNDEHVFTELAAEWLWARFDRGITAHMRRDDPLALESLAPLPALASRAEAACVAFGALPAPRSDDTRKAPYPCFPYLRDVDLLLADTIRRVAHPKPKPDVASLAALRQPDRVRALVDALDEVAARQDGQPGGVLLAEDPIVQALVAEGEAAVEPLLDVLEDDTRLTRSVQFFRDFSRSRALMGVYLAAYTAIEAILDASAFEASAREDLEDKGMKGRRIVAKRLGALYAKWKGVPVEERWYRRLADDTASAEVWLDAARSITLPTNETVIGGGSLYVATSLLPTPPGQPPSLRGEVLRAKTSPSVTDLLTKRADLLASLGASNAPGAPGGSVASAGSPGLDSACTMAEALGTWDAHGGAPGITRTMRTAIAASAPTTGHLGFGRCIALLASARDAGGDPGGFADYAQWITTTAALGDVTEPAVYFQPMVDHPTDAVLVAASEIVFAPGSKWMPILPLAQVAGREFAWDLSEMVRTDTLRVAAYRARVLEALADTRKAGTVLALSDGGLRVAMAAGWTSGTGIEANDPLAPKEGTTLDVRVCDYVASELAARQGAPRFHLYWPLAQRDKALATMIRYVRGIS